MTLNIKAHHCLVDVSSSLKLDDSVGVGGKGLGVFRCAPSLCWLDLQLDRRGPLLSGPRRDKGVLRHHLTTTAPEQQQHNRFVLRPEDS